MKSWTFHWCPFPPPPFEPQNHPSLSSVLKTQLRANQRSLPTSSTKLRLTKAVPKKRHWDKAAIVTMTPNGRSLGLADCLSQSTRSPSLEKDCQAFCLGFQRKNVQKLETIKIFKGWRSNINRYIQDARFYGLLCLSVVPFAVLDVDIIIKTAVVSLPQLISQHIYDFKPSSSNPPRTPAPPAASIAPVPPMPPPMPPPVAGIAPGP